MVTVLTCAYLVVSSSGDMLSEPSLEEARDATSTHVLAFSSQGELLVAESEGEFSLSTWEKVLEAGARRCGGSGEDGSRRMDIDSSIGDQETWTRNLVEEKMNAGRSR